MYDSAREYLAILRRTAESLPPLDTKARRKAFYATSPLIYNEYIDFGLGCWIAYKCSMARGETADLEETIREYLAWPLARLKFDGAVPPKHVMKLASLFEITGNEIDELAEYCDGNLPWGRRLNRKVRAERLSRASAQVLAFPTGRAMHHEHAVETA